MNFSKPPHPDAMLSRKHVALALTELGFPIASSTLATKAAGKNRATGAAKCKGPPYQIFGRVALYRWADALAWAEARRVAPNGKAARAEVHHDQAA